MSLNCLNTGTLPRTMYRFKPLLRFTIYSFYLFPGPAGPPNRIRCSLYCKLVRQKFFFQGKNRDFPNKGKGERKKGSGTVKKLEEYETAKAGEAVSA